MKSVFHLNNGTNNSQRIIFIQRHSKGKHLVEVFSSEMKPESFETILKSKRYTFLGSSFEMKKIFSFIMDYEKEAFILNLIGWHPEHRVYAFADAIFSEHKDLFKVDNLGIVETGKESYYLPAFGYANLLNEDYKIHRLYKFSQGETDFKTWSELFFRAYGNNGVIGDAGTGKTQFTKKLLRLFGNDVIGTSLNNATTPGLSRTASQKSNSLVYLKEYTNETKENIQDFILTAYVSGSIRHMIHRRFIFSPNVKYWCWAYYAIFCFGCDQNRLERCGVYQQVKGEYSPLYPFNCLKYK